MDIATIASTAIALLSSFFAKSLDKAGERAGDAAWDAARSVFQAVRTKLQADSTGGVIDELAKAPSDPGAKSAASASLACALEADPGYAAEIANLLRMADAAGVDSTFKTNIHGNVGKFVQIGVVQGDVNL